MAELEILTDRFNQILQDLAKFKDPRLVPQSLIEELAEVGNALHALGDPIEDINDARNEARAGVGL